ncbi:type III-B CRISPR module-associated protein Cmr5 [Thiorhodospira sibirica]|uniref:type III-B CRISPR module-associated protein Cmr5 n=1 Tax=Thiorhodospira sibirica TaxID=154347 RepID=UPI00022C5881|nr:type III-B CRISPR module-associated protein Cmr5 [Thiorhodospira sibirica]
MSKLIEQQRAEFALRAIENALAMPENSHYQHKELKSYARRLPAMIQSNGFGQAMAFYYSKREKFHAYGMIYQMVEDWLCRSGQVYAGTNEAPRLLKAITQHDQMMYRRAQAETLALMIWVKKFAEALISADDAA